MMLFMASFSVHCDGNENKDELEEKLLTLILYFLLFSSVTGFFDYVPVVIDRVPISSRP